VLFKLLKKKVKKEIIKGVPAKRPFVDKITVNVLPKMLNVVICVNVMK